MSTAKINAVREVVLNETFRTLGIKMDVAEHGLCIGNLREWYTLGAVEINPAMCGPVGVMFTDISCKVTIGYVESKKNPDTAPEVHFCFSYDYNHPNGGHNGYTVRKVVPVTL